MLLANSGIDKTQQISILAASDRRVTQMDDNFTTEDYLIAVDFSTIYTVLRQWDQTTVTSKFGSSSNTFRPERTNALQVNASTNISGASINVESTDSNLIG